MFFICVLGTGRSLPGPQLLGHRLVARGLFWGAEAGRWWSPGVGRAVLQFLEQ